MSAETIVEKYSEIGVNYGTEAVKFARGILAIYAEGKGRDSRLWNIVLELYENEEIIVFDETLSI